MNTRTILKALKKQLLLLENDTLDFNSMWTENTSSWLGLAFEESDELLKKYNQLASTYIYNYKLSQNKDELIAVTKIAYKSILQSAIERLKIVGMKKPKGNFVSEFSNVAILGFIFSIFTIGATLTEWIHKLIDNKNTSVSSSKFDSSSMNSNANIKKYAITHTVQASEINK